MVTCIEDGIGAQTRGTQDFMTCIHLLGRLVDLKEPFLPLPDAG
jgi:hypothetical protein